MRILNISPLQGSAAGGTEIKIEGYGIENTRCGEIEFGTGTNAKLKLIPLAVFGEETRVKKDEDPGIYRNETLMNTTDEYNPL